MEYVSLHGSWELLSSDQSGPLLAQVPGNVHQALLEAGEIPDPYQGENERGLQWIGEQDWSFSRKVTIDQDLLAHEHLDLVCEGLDTLATVVWNGQELGKTDNMFRRWTFDLKEHAVVGGNTLEICFTSPLSLMREQQEKRALVGVHNIEHEPHGRGYVRKEQCNFGWDWGPVLVTCGISGNIGIRAWGHACLNELTTSQRFNENGAAVLTVNALLIGEPLAADRFQVSLSKEDTVLQTVDLPEGSTSCDFVVEHPARWWPNGFGDQPLYEVTVTHFRKESKLSAVSKRIGFREIELVTEKDEWGESFFFRVNGVPVFAKGANWIPADTLHRESPEHLRDLLKSAAETHQNMIRVWGGAIYECDLFYDLCDEQGLMVWQDFMFACSAYPGDDPEFQSTVKAEVRDQAVRLGDHACLALWCGNNELEMCDVDFHGGSWPRLPLDVYETLFDEIIPRALTSVRPEAVYWPSSSHSPGPGRDTPNDPDRGDAHLWEVWHGNQPFEWYRGSLHRFCSEFGFQSYPEMRTIETYTRKHERNITSPAMEFHQRSTVGNEKIIRYMLSWYRMPSGLEQTVRLSQLQQGLAIQYAVEHWRVHRPRCMGAIYWQLNDCWPVASWSSIDYFGRWKTLHYLAKRFFAPLMVAGVEDSKTGTVSVHVVNDLPSPAEGELRWAITDLSGHEVECGIVAVQAGGCASTLVTTVDCNEALAELGDRNLMVWLDLMVEGECVSDSVCHFVRPKHMDLHSARVNIEVEQREEDAFALTLSTSTVALWAHVECRDVDVRFSDNDVCLRPGHPRTLLLQSKEPLSLDHVRNQVTVTTLVDTYA